MARKRKRQYSEVDYWKPFADVLAAILLTVLLFTIVLLLYFNTNNKTNTKNDEAKRVTTRVQVTTNTPQTTNPPTTTSRHSEGETTTEVETGDKDKAKTAVKVKVIDAKTKNLIRKKNIKFELYTRGGSRRSLSIYYPVKKLYDVYKTDDNGKFYLPEKIETGRYYLKQISDVKGYDRNERTNFKVLDIHDWSNAYEVKVKLGTSKNRIFITQLDSEKGTVVKGGKYQILAAEDIETLDGTVRYSTGQIVDTVVINKKGTGWSKKLYLGKYQVKQVEAPGFYAALDKPEEVKVGVIAKVGKKVPKEILISKTKYQVEVVDENADDIKIEDAVLNVINTANNVEKQYKTDANGIIVLEDLYKNATYEIVQESTKDGYKYDDKTYSFSVDKLGRINKKNTDELTITNRITRVSISVKDKLLDFSLGKYNILLEDSSGKTIDTWSSEDKEHQIKGLDEGKYRIIVSGPKQQEKIIDVKDISSPQSYTVAVWTWLDVGLLIIVGLILIAIIVLLFKLKNKIKKRANKRKEEKKKRKEIVQSIKNKE